MCSDTLIYIAVQGGAHPQLTLPGATPGQVAAAAAVAAAPQRAGAGVADAAAAGEATTACVPRMAVGSLTLRGQRHTLTEPPCRNLRRSWLSPCYRGAGLSLSSRDLLHGADAGFARVVILEN